MRKIYLKIGRKKINITKEIGREVRKLHFGVDLIVRETLENQTLTDLLFDTSIEVIDKGEGTDLIARPFIVKTVDDGSGETYFILGSCLTKGLV